MGSVARLIKTRGSKKFYIVSTAPSTQQDNNIVYIGDIHQAITTEEYIKAAFDHVTDANAARREKKHFSTRHKHEAISRANGMNHGERWRTSNNHSNSTNQTCTRRARKSDKHLKQEHLRKEAELIHEWRFHFYADIDSDHFANKEDSTPVGRTWRPDDEFDQGELEWLYRDWISALADKKETETTEQAIHIFEDNIFDWGISSHPGYWDDYPSEFCSNEIDDKHLVGQSATFGSIDDESDPRDDDIFAGYGEFDLTLYSNIIPRPSMRPLRNVKKENRIAVL